MSRPPVTAAVSTALADNDPGHTLTGVRLEVGQWSDVIFARSSRWGAVVIKVPHRRLLTSDNEPFLDMRSVLRKEYQVGTALAGGDIPVARPLLLCVDSVDGPDFLVSAYVAAADPRPDDAGLAVAVRALHALPVDTVPATDAGRWSDLVVQLTTHRLARLSAHTGRDLRCPALADLVATRADTATALVHMDVRAANTVWRGNRLAALLDWGNADLADPLLELMRIEQYGEVGPQFWATYGWAPGTDPDTGAVEDAYRLHTAVMLALVFTGTGDTARAVDYTQRVARLCERLR